MSLSLYKKPKYIENATKAKYGQHIFVLGALKDNIVKFWEEVHYRVDPEIGIKRPKEVGRTVVDIDCKTHANLADRDVEDGNPDQKKPADWFDEFQITSKKSKDESTTKTYSLELGKTRQYNIGGNLDVSGKFFNIAGAGIGGSAMYSNIKSQKETTSQAKDEKLSQEYQVVDALKVPPKTQVKAVITTWAVSYEAATRTVLSIDAKANIPVIYRTPFSQLFGGLCKSSGYLTAEDIFQGEDNYNVDDDGILSFTRDSKVSYLGEEVEIRKEKTYLQD